MSSGSGRPTVETVTPALWTYAWWALVGALFGFAVLGLLSIGMGLLATGGTLAAVGLRLPRLRNHSILAVFAGVAVAPLYVAWINRDGPGRVCRFVDSGSACGEEWAPWPFVLLALFLMSASVFLVQLARRG